MPGEPFLDSAQAARLRAAAAALGAPDRAERDAGEGTLLGAGAAAVPHLVEAVARTGSPSPVTRAALLLCALRAREALPALFARIEARDLTPEQRPFVARALAGLLDGQDAFDDRARAAVEALAADPERTTRAFAAQAFGALGDLRSKARVQALARDPDPWVRDQAQAVLARLAETEALAASDTGAGDFAALVAQANADGGALKPWLDDLGDARRAVRDAAAAALVGAGKGAVPFLIDKLNQPQPRSRIGAALVLGRLQATDAAVPLLIAATAPAATDDERELRAVALRALANCLTGIEDGLAASIVPLARDEDRFVRAAALLCLGRLADRAGMRVVVQAIVEDDPFVVESAAVALAEGAREDDVELVRPLLSALERRSPRPAVREAILIALSRVTITPPPLRVRVRHRVRPEVNGATASTRKAAIALLEGMFADDDPPPILLVDDVLGRLEDDHPEVRVVAASFTRAHLPPGMSGAVARLMAAFRRGEQTLALLCLEALRRHDTAEAQAALEAARAFGEPFAARAGELLDGFSPSTTTWTWTPRTAPPAPTTPPRAESQRPRPADGPGRVRAVTLPPTSSTDVPGNAPADDGSVVDARFSGDR
ncbi:MAG: HEAT repeat domain-containing protein [Deltaproteobacteria bacterium]|nr:HEAT repeat domain-containing protein [Deltaproteobacteria bacterium]